MGFKRVWDSSCPRVWDKWESDGTTWVIRDLAPEDDEEAIKLVLETLCPDETLCIFSRYHVMHWRSGGKATLRDACVPYALLGRLDAELDAIDILDDPVSMQHLLKFVRACLALRMSLACYVENNGRSKLVALNLCSVICKGEDVDEIEGERWRNVHGATRLARNKVDILKYLGIDKILCGHGLGVIREYRGAKLASRILEARQALCLHNGIKGTCSVFTSPASQISAARAGFETISTTTFKELAESGFNYPKDESKDIKVMVKKFV